MITLDNIRIILVKTSHPGNIGSTARAMKTMGLKHLTLVNPKSFPDTKANELAAGAQDVLDNATIVTTLAEALADARLVLGTSARPRGISLPGFLPREAAQYVASQSEGQTVAILFGPEDSGLSNEDLLRCHYHIQIPGNPEYSVLNLAQAVQIICYELRLKLINPQVMVELREDKLATQEAVENFFIHLKQILEEIEFLNPDNPRRLMQRLRRLFNRVQLEEMEVNLLRGILTQIEHHKEKNTMN